MYVFSGNNPADVDIFHNTVSFHHTSGKVSTGSIYGIWVGDVTGDVKNNIVYADIETSGIFYGMSDLDNQSYGGGPANFDNNSVYLEDITTSGSGEIFYGRLRGSGNVITDYKTFNDLKNGFGANWYNEPLSYVDRDNQDFRITSFALSNIGVPTDITTDINGKTRHATSPSMGAIESDIDFSNSGLNFATNPTECGGFSQPVSVTIKNENTYPITNIPLAYDIDGGSAVTEVLAGPIAAGASVNYTFSETPKFNTPGTNTLNAYINGDDENLTNDSSSYSFDILSSTTGALLSQGTTFEGYFEAGTELNPDAIANLYTNEYDISRPTKYSTSAPGADYTYAITATDQNGIDVTAAGFSYAALAESFTISPEDSLSGRSITVNILVSDANTGCDATITRSMYIPHTPKPSFDANDICLGDIAQFKNTSTLEGSGLITTNWDFADPDPAVTDDNSDNEDGFWEYTTYGNDIVVEMTVRNELYPKFSYKTNNTIDVTPKPVIDFKVLNACEGLPITIQNNTTSPVSDPIIYDWDFDGEYTTTDVDPSYTFATSGQRKISVTATANGCFASLTKNAYQFEMLIADFTSEGECNFVNVDFTNNSTIENGANIGYKWDFAGEGISREQDPAFAFATLGTKSFTLTATSDFGCVNTFTKDITLQESPEADFAWDAACNLTPINFTITGSLPNGGANSSYDWDFAGEASAIRADPSHLFSRVGPKIVKLTISDLNGCSSSIEKEVNVVLQAVADFEVSSSICLNDEVAFTNKSTVAAGDLTYEWTLGDGTITNDLNPTYKYSEAREYDVILKAIVEGGCSDEVTYPIVVNPSQDATFTLAKDGRTVVCDGPAGNDIYRWTFGDGNKDDSEDPTYTFENVDQGTFKVCLATKKGECWNDEC